MSRARLAVRSAAIMVVPEPPNRSSTMSRLTALSDEHFNVGPDEINWCHVGDLGLYAELLKRITDSAFNEGENAE